MIIKKFNALNEENKNTTNEGMETENYMFFANLKTIKRLVDEMLEMDETEVDTILKNGHNWAVDHIATSKDDVEEVFNFLAGEKEDRTEEGSDENIKGFNDFNS